MNNIYVSPIKKLVEDYMYNKENLPVVTNFSGLFETSDFDESINNGGKYLWAIHSSVIQVK
jgi:hypothetical protein